AAKADGLKTERDQLQTKLEQTEARVVELEPVAAKVPDLEKEAQRATELQQKIETLEADKLKAEEERDAEKQRADSADEKANQATLREERFEALGEGFKNRLDK